MRLAVFLFVALSFHSKKPSVLTGMVSLDGEAFPGCTVKVIENGVSMLTDSDGKFRLIIDDLENLTLVITFLDLTPILIIEDIPLKNSEIDLGDIPLVLNSTATASDYKMFDSKKREQYQEIRHWTKLSGYISKTNVDTTSLRTTLNKRKIKYRLDSLSNKVVVNYKDWSK